MGAVREVYGIMRCAAVGWKVTIVTEEQNFVFGGVDGSLFNLGWSLQRKHIDAVKKLSLCHFQVLAISNVD